MVTAFPTVNTLLAAGDDIETVGMAPTGVVTLRLIVEVSNVAPALDVARARMVCAPTVAVTVYAKL
jgi:hypothetical protein